MKTALVYGTSTGNTERIAEEIQGQLEDFLDVTMLDVGEIEPAAFQEYELIVIGIPTWNTGELQDDWVAMVDQLTDIDLSGRRIAIFGLGDAIGYAYNFQDGMGILHQHFTSLGATAELGYTSTDGYDFKESLALVEDGSVFCGLALDEDNESEESDDRIEAWVKQLKSELAA